MSDLKNGDTNICFSCSSPIRFDLRHPDGDGEWRHVGQVFGEPGHSAEPANLEEQDEDETSTEFRDPVADPEVEVSTPDKTRYFKTKHEQAIESLIALTIDKEVDPRVRFNAAIAILDYVDEEMS